MIKGGLGLYKKSETNLPLVSIITVVYNGAKHIEQTIKSVLNQSYKNIEYIIIDGGSTDNTVEIIKRYEDKIDYWQSERDGGIYFAMNKGISLAKGELIGIINADDFYLSETIAKIIDEDKIHHADIYHGNMQYISEEGGLLSIGKPDITKMYETPAIFHPTCFVKRSVYDKAGLFDTQYKISADYDFLLRCLKQNFKFSYIAQTLTCFRLGGMSGSCYSNIEGYRIMKTHQTGHYKKIVWRTIKCYIKNIPKKNDKFGKKQMIKLITYIEAVFRNVSSRWKGRLLKIYLVLHGCKVGKGLKCSSFPYFKGFPNKNIFIGDYVDLGRNNTFEISKEGKIILEDYVLFHQNILISCNKEIKIKKWAALAENVSIRDGNHKFAKDEYYRKQEGIAEAIEIGEDAGVSAGCVVLMGSKIAKGVFIGSNSVVTRKTVTEEYGIYAGNPIKLILKRA